MLWGRAGRRARACKGRAEARALKQPRLSGMPPPPAQESAIIAEAWAWVSAPPFLRSTLRAAAINECPGRL